MRKVGYKGEPLEMSGHWVIGSSLVGSGCSFPVSGLLAHLSRYEFEVTWSCYVYIGKKPGV